MRDIKANKVIKVNGQRLIVLPVLESNGCIGCVYLESDSPWKCVQSGLSCTSGTRLDKTNVIFMLVDSEIRVDTVD